MSEFIKVNRKKIVFVLFTATLLVGLKIHLLAGEPEIALIFGEPWEDMRRRSSASIGPAIPGHHWFDMPRSDARLHFIDPEYGFTTPPARFLTVDFDNEQRVNGIRMSPQVEPLLLDDTLKVVLGLQDQWHRGGWTPIRVQYDPPIEDTPQWRTRLRDRYQSNVSYWHAGDKYQIRLGVRLFHADRNPNEERFLITLSLGKPWTQP